jgi:hypothetical protein
VVPNIIHYKACTIYLIGLEITVSVL